MKKRFVGLVMAFVVLILCIPVCTHAEIIASGNEHGEGCTENDELHWTLDSDGLLTISGTGGFSQSGALSDIKDKIKSVVIEDGITDIMSWLFMRCSQLTSITIPDSVTQIGEDAFGGTAYYDNENNWENGVLYIGNHLIAAKSDITALTVKPGTLTIAKDAFNDCASLTDITLADSLKSIPENMFDNTAFYKNEDNWENGLLYNGNYLITAKNDITSANIKEGTTVAASCALGWCENLESVTLPDSLTTMGERMFICCSALKSIDIPDTITSIGGSAFGMCSSLETVVIPTGVTHIADGLLSYSGITSIDIPDSVTSMGDGVFDTCEKLKSVKIGCSLSEVGNFAFNLCTALETIDVSPNNPIYKSVDNVLFSKDGTEILLYPSLKEGAEYTVPDGVTKIDDCAFRVCPNLKRVIIPEGVTAIGECVFEGTPITEITIPDSMTDIAFSAFLGCQNLTSARVGSGLKNIAEAFEYADFLTTIEVSPENPYYRSENNVVFSKDKTELALFPSGRTDEEYIIPEGITKIGDYAFYGNQSIKNVTIPEGVTAIGKEAFYYCNSLANAAMPSSIRTIGEMAFSCCYALTAVTIPYSVTSIDYATFRRCTALKIVTIPVTVTQIGEDAFYNCDAIGNIYYSGNLSQWSSIKILSGNDQIKRAAKHYNFQMPTPLPISTPNVTPSASPMPSPTVTPTSSPTASPTATPSASPTAEPTATPTATPTVTPTAIPTATPTATPKLDFEVSNGRLIYNGTKTNTVLLIFAKYSGTSLETVKFASFDLTNKETSIAAYSDYDKMFIWDGVNSMRPVTEHKKLKIPKN